MWINEKSFVFIMQTGQVGIPSDQFPASLPEGEGWKLELQFGTAKRRFPATLLMRASGTPIKVKDEVCDIFFERAICSPCKHTKIQCRRST